MVLGHTSDPRFFDDMQDTHFPGNSGVNSILCGAKYVRSRGLGNPSKSRDSSVQEPTMTNSTPAYFHGPSKLKPNRPHLETRRIIPLIVVIVLLHGYTYLTTTSNETHQWSHRLTSC